MQETTKWFEHVGRVKEEDHAKSLIIWEITEKRRKVGHRSKWFKELEKDLKESGLKNSKRKAKDRIH